MDPNSELQRRYNALNAAASTGDAEKVSAASRNVLGLAIRQAGNLRMLVNANREATELYRESLRWEEIPETHLDLAIALLRDGNIDDALTETSTVLSISPDNARAWHVQGRVQILRKDYAAAIEALTRSLKLKRDINAQFALGTAHLSAGDKNKAQQVFDQMIAEQGDRAIWHVIFGGAYRQAHMLDDAVREFKRAIALDTNIENAHFFLGLTLLEQNMWARTDESMAEFREAVRQRPNDFAANFYLGVGESQLQQFEQSDAHLNAALATQPQSAETTLYLGLNAFQQNKYPQAKTYLLKALELSEKTKRPISQDQLRRAYFSLGRTYFIEGNKQESDKWIQKAKQAQQSSLAQSAETVTEVTGGMGNSAMMPRIDVKDQPTAEAQPATVDATAPINPSLLAGANLSAEDREQVNTLDKQLRTIIASAYNDWGTADARRGNYELALDRFQAAERWDRTVPGVLRNVGLAAFRLQNLEETIRALKAAVEVDSNDQISRARLAMIYFRTDQFPQAVEQFRGLGEAAYIDPAAAYAFSYSLVQVNNSKQASAVLNRLSSMKLPPDALMNIGDLYAVLADYDHAIASYRKALQLAPETTGARFKIGASLLRLSRPQDALPELQAAIKQTPTDAEVQYQLAYALLETSRKQEGLTLLQQMVTQHPDHPNGQYLLGKTLVAEGQYEAALPHLEAAVKLQPESSYAHYQLQTAYRRLGRTADADREAAIYRDLKNRKREQAVIPQPERPE